MKTIIKTEETVKNGIIAIGQSLIERAEEVARDLDGVTSITIFAKINPGEITNFDITKNYVARFKEENKDIKNELKDDSCQKTT